MLAAFKLRPGTAPFVEGALQVARSDADGRFVFRNVAPGRYWIHYDLDANGGWGGDGVVVGSDGAHKEVNWSNPSRADVDDLNFLATDIDGNPLAGVMVDWRRFSGAVGGPACGSEVLTDVDGRAKASQVPAGTYRITAQTAGRASLPRDLKFGSGYEKTVILRLLTPEEADRYARTVIQGWCISSHETAAVSLDALVARADAIVVGRIATAVLDPDYGSDPPYPRVRTRYDINLTEVLKPHPQLSARGQSLPLLHGAGEMEWADKNVVGCEGPTMRTGETYVLSLRWNDAARAFTLLSGGAYIANVTTGDVAPVRLSYTPSPIIHERKGLPAPQFLGEIRAALKKAR